MGTLFGWLFSGSEICPDRPPFTEASIDIFGSEVTGATCMAKRRCCEPCGNALDDIHQTDGGAPTKEAVDAAPASDCLFLRSCSLNQNRSRSIMIGYSLPFESQLIAQRRSSFNQSVLIINTGHGALTKTCASTPAGR